MRVMEIQDEKRNPPPPVIINEQPPQTNPQASASVEPNLQTIKEVTEIRETEHLDQVRDEIPLTPN